MLSSQECATTSCSITSKPSMILCSYLCLCLTLSVLFTVLLPTSNTECSDVTWTCEEFFTRLCSPGIQGGRDFSSLGAGMATCRRFRMPSTFFVFTFISTLYARSLSHACQHINNVWMCVCVCVCVCVCARMHAHVRTHMYMNMMDTALRKHTHVCTTVIVFQTISLLAIHFITLNMATIQLFWLSGWSQWYTPFSTSETVTYMQEDKIYIRWMKVLVHCNSNLTLRPK